MGIFLPAWVKGMATSNVIGCFRAAGVYPVDRWVILSQLETAGSPHQHQLYHSVHQGEVGLLFPHLPPLRNHQALHSQGLRWNIFRKESTETNYALWLQPFHLQAAGHATAWGGVMEAILQRPTSSVQRKPLRYTAVLMYSPVSIAYRSSTKEKKRTKQEEKEGRRMEHEEINKVYKSPLSRKLHTYLTIVCSGMLPSLQEDSQRISSTSYSQHQLHRGSAQRRQACTKEDGSKLWPTWSTLQAMVGKCQCKIKFCNCLYQSSSSKWHLASISSRSRVGLSNWGCEILKARKWVYCDHCPLWYHCLCARIAHKSAKDKNYKCLSCTQAWQHPHNPLYWAKHDISFT